MQLDVALVHLFEPFFVGQRVIGVLILGWRSVGEDVVLQVGADRLRLLAQRVLRPPALVRDDLACCSNSSLARYPPTGSIFAQSMLPSLRFTFGKTPTTAKMINKKPGKIKPMIVAIAAAPPRSMIDRVTAPPSAAAPKMINPTH
jgi:hypothetical protein